MKVTSPKQVENDIRTSSPIEATQEVAQNASWKAGVAKLTVVAKITNEKPEKTKESSNKINSSSHSIQITTETKDEEQIEDTSISIEAKTYNVPEKDKNATKSKNEFKEKEKSNKKSVKHVIQKGKSIAEVDKKTSQKDKIITNVAEKSNTVPEVDDKGLEKGKTSKDKIVTEINVAEKDKILTEINKNVTDKEVKKKDTAVKNDQIVRRDSNKSAERDKGADQKMIGSPKRSLTESLDIKPNEKEMAAANKVKAYKSVEQKSVARTKRLGKLKSIIKVINCDIEICS